MDTNEFANRLKATKATVAAQNRLEKERQIELAEAQRSANAQKRMFDPACIETEVNRVLENLLSKLNSEKLAPGNDVFVTCVSFLNGHDHPVTTIDGIGRRVYLKSNEAFLPLIIPANVKVYELLQQMSSTSGWKPVIQEYSIDSVDNTRYGIFVKYSG